MSVFITRSLLFTPASNIQAPEEINFERAAIRAARAREQEKLEAERVEAAAAAAQEQQQRDIGLGHPSNSDATFVSQRNDGDETIIRGGGTHATRGRGGAVSARGRALSGATGKTATQKKKDALIKFAQPIIMMLPIEFREKQVGQPRRREVHTDLSDSATTQRCRSCHWSVA